MLVRCCDPTVKMESYPFLGSGLLISYVLYSPISLRRLLREGLLPREPVALDFLVHREIQTSLLFGADAFPQSLNF